MKLNLISRKYIIILAFLISVNSRAQNFPKLGNDTLLDVANWNIEWFGDGSNGPTDEVLQYTNVKAMIDKTDLDVFALAEISNGNTYNTLSNELATKYDTYISTFSQTQKTGIYWKKSMFKLLVNQSLNLVLNSTDNYNFASRPPLQVCLQTIGGTKVDTIYFLVIHMKAFSDQSSYDRRVGAGAALKTYLETSLVGKKYIVLGDWNDDLDQSIYGGLESPYKNFLSANYTFPSKELTDAGKSSYAFSVNMIDHQLISKTLDSFYFKGSARVFDLAPNYCSGFSNNTSDHFPVYAAYDWKKLTTRIIPAGISNVASLPQVRIYPNPANTELSIDCEKEITRIEVYNLQGQICLWQDELNAKGNAIEVNVQSLNQGMYYLKIEIEGMVFVRSFQKQ